MSLASAVYAKGGPKNDDPGEALPLPIPTIETGKVKSQGLDQQSGDVRWILPGPRRLDPAVFGTPAAPLGFEPDVGVPLAARLTTPDGSAYTTTAGPTPFSDNAAIVSGQYTLDAIDNTLVDDPASEDILNYQAAVTSPAGDTIEIEVTQILPVGIDHAVFGTETGGPKAVSCPLILIWKPRASGVSCVLCISSSSQQAISLEEYERPELLVASTVRLVDAYMGNNLRPG